MTADPTSVYNAVNSRRMYTLLEVREVSVRILLTHEQLAMEEAADRLLRSAPRDPACPVYTERQLSRHGRVVLSLDEIVDRVTTPVQSLSDELRFLAAVTPMNPTSRTVLRLWTDGWTQAEIGEACGISQQRVSQRLRRALAACYDSTPISFRRFSHHTIYRPPRKGAARRTRQETDS